MHARTKRILACATLTLALMLAGCGSSSKSGNSGGGGGSLTDFFEGLRNLLQGDGTTSATGDKLIDTQPIVELHFIDLAGKQDTIVPSKTNTAGHDLVVNRPHPDSITMLAKGFNENGVGQVSLHQQFVQQCPGAALTRTAAVTLVAYPATAPAGAASLPTERWTSASTNVVNKSITAGCDAATIIWGTATSATGKMSTDSYYVELKYTDTDPIKHANAFDVWIPKAVTGTTVAGGTTATTESGPTKTYAFCVSRKVANNPIDEINITVQGHSETEAESIAVAQYGPAGYNVNAGTCPKH